MRKPETVQRPPVPELELVDIEVPDMTRLLPLTKPASATLKVTLRKLPMISNETVPATDIGSVSREDLCNSSSFNHDPRTGTIPVQLASLSECNRVFDDDQKHIGFMSFDEDGIQPRDTLFCVHISTLRDEVMSAAQEELDKPGVESVPQPPILAYALVLRATGAAGNEFRRVGIAEMNYDWMTNGSKTVIKMV